MYLIIIGLVVQMVILFTIWYYFKTKIKSVEQENKKIKKVVDAQSQSKPVWEEIGLTEDEYKETRSLVYGIQSPNVSLYTPGLDDVVEIKETNQLVNKDIEDEQPIQPKKSELSELLGIEDANELEQLQKEIEDSQPNVTQYQPKTISTNNLEGNDVFGEPTSVNTEEELQKVMNEIEGLTPSIETKESPVQISPIGNAIDLFDEIIESINQEEQNTPILFSENNPTSTFVIEQDEPMPTDSDAPYFEPVEIEEVEQAKMIQILNLLDLESARMNNELDITEELNEKTLVKQEIATKLAILTNEEGTKNMREIVALLNKLYELEGKEEDMKALREEYKEYFEETTPIKVFEEDIISIDKEYNKEDFDIPEKYLWMASAQISDGIQGKQRWVGKVIGLNNSGDMSFIHFRDLSQRIWINVGALEYKTIEKGDILTIFINREGESIVAEDIQHVKKAIA